MANEEHMAILRQGVEAWNAWREEQPNTKPDLRSASFIEVNLSKADLRRVDLRGATLTRADLRQVRLTDATLNEAILVEVNLSGADLNRADLSGARLMRVDLSQARLVDTNFSRADLSQTNLTSAYLLSTIFANVDLSTSQGLESIYHQGPSELGVQTLYRSKGKIPESFLRGCGVPDTLIEYLPSLLGAQELIQYYSCFISYSSKDDAFARRLHERMRAEHLRVWFAPEDLKGGDKLFDQLDRAIQLHDRLLLVLSEESIRSEWVMTELRRALKAEREENRRKLFPIRLCSFEALDAWTCVDETGRDVALEIKKYFIPDFSQWKDHDAFEWAFARLLGDLRAAEGAG